MITRAEFLSGLLAGLAVGGGAAAASAGPPLRISPNGSATGDGATWETAGSLASLPAFVAAAAGREIWIRADQGPYLIGQYLNSITLSAGGTEAAPVVIRGVTADGKRSVAVINGTRATASHSNSTSVWVRGHDVFKIRADWLTFADLHFNQQSRIFDLFGDRVGISLINVSAAYYRIFFTNMSAGNASQGTLRRFVIRGGKHDYMDNYTINLFSASDGVIEDVVMDGHGMRSSAPVPNGVHLMEANGAPSRNIVVRRCKAANILCSTTTAGTYWNGDGFADERDCFDIRYEDCEASGMTDGGFDLKSENVVLLRCKSSGNKKNYRLWGSGVLTDCESNDPVKQGSGPACHCDFPSAVERSSVFALDHFQANGPQSDPDVILNFGSVAPVQLTVSDANFAPPGGGASALAAPASADSSTGMKLVSVTQGFAEPVITWR